MIGLLDLNNAYASMEALFDPSIRGRPIVVASNCDGCAVARSAEAKALGVQMGQPIHEIPPAVRKQLVVRSANFTLYGSLSNRVFNLVRESVPVVERYSVDEIFLDLSRVADRQAFAAALSQRVRRHVGLANCVGIGPTLTLAKLANRIAKRGAGVVDLGKADTHVEALSGVDVGDVWGVGRKWAPRLAGLGIRTALELREAAPDLIGEQFGVVLLRTQQELKGRPCRGLQAEDPDRQTIAVTRTFGQRISEPEQVTQAMATFAARAAEKARLGGLVAAGIQVFAHTDWFRSELPQHHPCRSVNLPVATADTRLILGVVRKLAVSMLRPSYGYKKAGVMLLGLQRPDDLPGDLFGPAVAGDEALMGVVDGINARFGRGSMQFASAAAKEQAAWRPRQRNLSPCYTTRLEDLPVAAC